jgi:hypothetical protein
MLKACVSRSNPVPSYLLETLVRLLFGLAASGVFAVNHRESMAQMSAHLARVETLRAAESLAAAGWSQLSTSTSPRRL